mmetsp:Transcript_23089/g.46982  ORF Transcript_23089/g.46982 Transcript_23089/m.46982 type:complete len:229 (-) Transcript_23089:585-1271(-)
MSPPTPGGAIVLEKSNRSVDEVLLNGESSAPASNVHLVLYDDSSWPHISAPSWPGYPIFTSALTRNLALRESLNAKSPFVKELLFLPNIPRFVFGPIVARVGKTFNSIFCSTVSLPFTTNLAIPRGIRSSPHFNPNSNFTTSGTNEACEVTEFPSLSSRESQGPPSLSSSREKCNLRLDFDFDISSSPRWLAQKTLVVFAFSPTLVRIGWLRAVYFPEPASSTKPTVI